MFRDVAELGAALANLSDLIGTTVPAEAAILFDWDNRWAVNDAQGPRNKGIGYEQTVVRHYRALWELGVPTDIVGSNDEFGGYKLLVVPMAYLMREETGAKIERFVRDGGTAVVTYWSGVVDENDLCHLGGFPGPLRTTVGVWAEEIEGLHDHDKNALAMQEGNPLGFGGTYEVREICELIHTETAEAIAFYGDDFYAGRPALTVNRLGSGRAYYLAARVSDPAFYDSFYEAVVRESNARRALDAALPAGVTAQLRTDGVRDYVFLLNFSGAPARVELDGSSAASYSDAETGESLAGTLELPANASRILKRA